MANNQQRKGKELWTEAEAGDRIGIYAAPDAENEALHIADSIEQLLSRDPNDQIAVLYRTNAQSRQLEEALRRYGRTYIVVGGLSFYHRAEVKDVLAYLKLLVSPDDRVSLSRVINKPARGIGRTTLEQIESHARENKSSLWQSIGTMLEEKQFGTRAAAAVGAFRKLIEELIDVAERETLGVLLKRITERSGYVEMLKSSATSDAETRLENLDELVNAGLEAAVRGEGPSEFLDHAALVSEADRVDNAAQVSLLTIHNAKGLEWPTVFIAGLEEGLFPHVRSIDSADAMEEERRLCYVGMTRARKRLGLTWARMRRKYGGGSNEPRAQSRFLREVPRQYTDQTDRGKPIPEVDLFAEQHQVRETVKKNTYTGKTYNSLENIAQFFQERGINPPVSKAAPARPAVRSPVLKKSPSKPKRGMRVGMTVEHPRYGKGMVLRREGDGERAKLTVNFPGHGLKKLVAKYAGLKVTE